MKKKFLIIVVLLILPVIFRIFILDSLFTNPTVELNDTLQHKPLYSNTYKIPYSYSLYNFIESDTFKNSYIPNNSDLIVIIDPGHGGSEVGARGKNLLEKDVVLDISLRLESILRLSGIQTRMTRNKDTYVSLQERVEKSNQLNASIFISIHNNWFNSPYPNGAFILYNPHKYICFTHPTPQALAEIINDELMQNLDMKNLGVFKNETLYVLKNTNMPSMLIELGFLSNPHDEALLSSSDFREKVAQNLAVGIKKSLLEINALGSPS